MNLYKESSSIRENEKGGEREREINGLNGNPWGAVR